MQKNGCKTRKYEKKKANIRKTYKIINNNTTWFNDVGIYL